MLVRSAGFLLIIFITKAEAYPAQIYSQHNLHQYVKNFFGEILSNDLINQLYESQTSIKQFLQTAKTTILRVQKCNPKTKLKLVELAALKYGDFEGCVNATRDVADFEQFVLHGFQYVLLVNKNLLEVAKSVIACHNQSNMFDDLKCAVTTLQDSGPLFQEIFSFAYNLTTEIQDDTNRLIKHIKQCFGYNTTMIFEEAMPLIHNYC